MSYFKIILAAICLLGNVLFSSPAFCETNLQTLTNTSPLINPDIIEVEKQIKQSNPELILEIARGIDALKQYDFIPAIGFFKNAIDIAPYDPLAYIFLIKTFLTLGQEDEAYKVLEEAGHNRTNNDAIIAELYTSLTEMLPPLDDSPLPLVSIAQFKNNKQCAVSMVFDDGELSVPTIIIPKLEEYGFTATISINPGLTPDDRSNPYRGNWEAWRKAKENGHEIANHGMNHQPLPGLTTQKLQIEVNDSLEIIKEKLGEAPLTFVFPEDETTPEITKFVEQSHLVVRDHDFLAQVYKRVCLPVYGGKRFSTQSAKMLTDITIKRRLWLIKEYHGVINPLIHKSYKPVSPEFFTERLDYLKKNADKIWVGRFIDVYKYLKEQKETRIDIKQSQKGKIIFSLSNSLDQTIYSYPLTIIINTAPSRPRQTKAVDLSNNTAIPVKIDGDKFYLDVVPSNKTIKVEWK